MNRTELSPLIEALIFASDTPLSIDKIKQIIEDVSKKEIEEIIEKLQNEYMQQNRGFQLKEVAHGYQYRTQPAFSHWLKKLKKSKPFRLTQPTLESLAIIAYKQPITRLEIEKLRGVDTGGIIKTLLEKKLICISGRKDVPGKPFLFSTTKTFLEVFSLEKLSSLPSIREIESLDDAQLPLVLRDKMTQNVEHINNDIIIPIDSEESIKGEVEPKTNFQPEDNQSTASAGDETLPCPSNEYATEEKPTESDV